MEERVVREGVVTAVDGEVLKIAVGRPDACGHCAAKNACSTFSGKRTHLARARNLCGAAVGQRVKLEMAAASLLTAAFFVYFLPSLALLLCAWAGSTWGHKLGLSPDAGAVTGAVVALVVAALSLFIHHRLRPDRPPAFCATEILEDAGVSCQEHPWSGSTPG